LLHALVSHLFQTKQVLHESQAAARTESPREMVTSFPPCETRNGKLYELQTPQNRGCCMHSSHTCSRPNRCYTSLRQQLAKTHHEKWLHLFHPVKHETESFTSCKRRKIAAAACTRLTPVRDQTGVTRVSGSS